MGRLADLNRQANNDILIGQVNIISDILVETGYAPGAVDGRGTVIHAGPGPDPSLPRPNLRIKGQAERLNQSDSHTPGTAQAPPSGERP